MKIPQKINIETPRLLLSDFDENDFSAFQGLFESLHQAGQQWFNVDVEKPETVKNFFEEILKNHQDDPRHTFRLAVRRKDANQIIGYVSLCNIYSSEEGKPDTGVLIDPRSQRGGFAREARIAINYFAATIGLEKLVCDIRANNMPSINNVVAMGYDQVMKDGQPVVVKTDTVNGQEDWHRFQISTEQVLSRLPQLIDSLARRYWRESILEVAGATLNLGRVINISDISASSGQPGRPLGNQQAPQGVVHKP